MSAVTIQQMADRVAALLEERLRVKGRGLAGKMRKAGRRLPRQVRDAAEVLAKAQMMSQSPRLLLQIDDETVALAYDVCLKHLNGIDPRARRRGAILDVTASIAFSLLVVAGLVLAVLFWRGFV